MSLFFRTPWINKYYRRNNIDSFCQKNTFHATLANCVMQLP